MELKTEHQKMLAGELYVAGDAELTELRKKARAWMAQYNQSADEKTFRSLLLKQILGSCADNIDIQIPFHIDYGCHLEVGDNFYANFNCVILDCNVVKIGNNVMLGPAVQIYAAFHPVDAAERIKGPELALPINIGDNVWIGGGSVICAGVTIGENTTIGAGSVVVKDIPANVVAAGNPCKVIRHLNHS